MNDSHDDWDLFLQMAISAYNNSYHSSIKMTPFEAQFGRKSVLVSDIIMNHQLPSSTRIRDIADFTLALRESAAYVNDIIHRNTIEAQNKQQYNYNKFVKNHASFKVGDIVKINNYRTRVGHSKAFEPKFLGPYKITKLIGELNYQLESPNLPSEMVHYNRMHHFTAREAMDEEPRNFTLQIQMNESFQATYEPKTTSISSFSIVPFSNLANVLRKRKKQREEQVFLEESQRLCLIESEVAPTPRRSRRIALQNGAPEETNDVVEDEAGNLIENSDKTCIFSKSSSSVELQQVVNTKGKPVLQCPNCKQLYERTTGLRVHLQWCKKV